MLKSLGRPVDDRRPAADDDEANAVRLQEQHYFFQAEDHPGSFLSAILAR
jgi:hypothetical protein